MTFNIRRRMPRLLPGNPDRWVKRRPLVARLLESEAPTIIGVQEALPDQAGFLRHALGRSYRPIGFGRNADKRGEGCPLFYDAHRLQLLQWEQTALSDTPAAPGSTTWGNKVPRVLVDAIFRDRETDLELRVMNTHFDHRSRNARIHSASLVRALVADDSLPTVLTGDFNTSVGSLPFEEITHGGTLVDTWAVAVERVTDAWGTFPDYKPPRLDHKRIDWILATAGIRVAKTGVNVTRFDGSWPSDHAPVQAIISLPG
ncbi:endonuclease/exonuclease/phosphatase family protein [Glaciihabitans sp. INWT7]|nr:endonuclease/exonuclease/phosphatase family protein [Glaciihabitans sp. INWT7]